jgi:hypothetical protein
MFHIQDEIVQFARAVIIPLGPMGPTRAILRIEGGSLELVGFRLQLRPRFGVYLKDSFKPLVFIRNFLTT